MSLPGEFPDAPDLPVGQRELDTLAELPSHLFGGGYLIECCAGEGDRDLLLALRWQVGVGGLRRLVVLATFNLDGVCPGWLLCDCLFPRRVQRREFYRGTAPLSALVTSVR